MSSSTAPSGAALSWAEAVESALGNLAVDGLEVEDEGRAMLAAIAREELTPDEAVRLTLEYFRT
ncbi:antitoxin VbhA family protein [Pseudonocardia phyllosphaerae]|uniref:antitoxin VbhA family protein n=1 Tax=Pseudonocardia phyllosphaerae TaxID=3390502 RepID=UPI0039784968